MTTNDNHGFSGWDDDSEAVHLGGVPGKNEGDYEAERWQMENAIAVKNAQIAAQAQRDTVAGPAAGNGVIQPQAGNDLARSFEIRWMEFVSGCDELSLIAARETEGQRRIVIYQGTNIYGTHRNIETAEKWLTNELETKRRHDKQRATIENAGPKIINSIEEATAESELKKNGMVQLSKRVDGLESQIALANAQLATIRDLLEKK